MSLDPRENRLRREAEEDARKVPPAPLEPDFPWQAVPWNADAFLPPVDTPAAGEPS